MRRRDDTRYVARPAAGPGHDRVVGRRWRAVTPGTAGRVGGQWLVFCSTAEPLLLGQYDARGHLVAQFKLREGTKIFGRAAPDITLTATDMIMSRRHASIVVGGGQVYVRELNSANGMFLKVDGVTRLTDGDMLRMGNQALRFGLVEAPVRSEVLKVATGRLQVARSPWSSPWHRERSWCSRTGNRRAHSNRDKRSAT